MTDEALQHNYAAAFGGKAGFGRFPALILIDFVEAYFAPESPLYAGVENALETTLRIREVARAARVPVILTNVVYHPGGIDGGRFFEKVPALTAFEAGNPMGAWPKGLVPHADELVLSKQYPSAFFGTSLASTLTARGIDQVILTGLSTSGCVRATCIDAVSHGFRTAVVAEGCGDRHPGPHEANLFDMNAKYADVVSEEQIVAYLSALEQAR
jgi:maleamate amidohydrolase